MIFLIILNYFINMLNFFFYLVFYLYMDDYSEFRSNVPTVIVEENMSFKKNEPKNEPNNEPQKNQLLDIRPVPKRRPIPQQPIYDPVENYEVDTSDIHSQGYPNQLKYILFAILSTQFILIYLNFKRT